MNTKRTLVNLYKDIVLVTRKSRDSNQCLSDRSTENGSVFATT